MVVIFFHLIYTEEFTEFIIYDFFKDACVPSFPSLQPEERDFEFSLGSLSLDVFLKFSRMDEWEGSQPTQTRTPEHCIRL